MKVLKIVLLIIFTNLIVFIFNSCEQSTIPLEDLTTAPSRTLSAREIMSVQGITSIHYVDYDSIIVNGKSDNSFSPTNEYYIDTCHYKSIQYYLDNHNWYTNVYDLCKNIVWNYYNGVLTYPQLPNWPAAYENAIKSAMGSWLEGPTTFLGTELIDDKLCNVYRDSSGYQEWIWIKYKLPIQRRAEAQIDVHQINLVRKEVIEINQNIPGNIYEPPK
jgi:hypothetical protein